MAILSFLRNEFSIFFSLLTSHPPPRAFFFFLITPSFLPRDGVAADHIKSKRFLWRSQFKIIESSLPFFLSSIRDGPGLSPALFVGGSNFFIPPIPAGHHFAFVPPFFFQFTTGRFGRHELPYVPPLSFPLGLPGPVTISSSPPFPKNNSFWLCDPLPFFMVRKSFSPFTVFLFTF